MMSVGKGGMIKMVIAYVVGGVAIILLVCMCVAPYFVGVEAKFCKEHDRTNR